MLKRPDFWRNLALVKTEMETEACRDAFVQTTMAMLEAHIEVVDDFLSGRLVLGRDVAPPRQQRQVPHAEVPLDREQVAALEQIMSRVHDAIGAKFAEQPVQAHSALAILGPAGSGKTTSVETSIRQTVAAGGNVLIACPTGMQASRFREKFPDLDVDTVHGAFLLHKPEQQAMHILEDYDLVVVEECGQLSAETFERILRTHDAAGERPALVFVGDFYQLRGVEPTRATDSPRWARDVTKYTLHTMRRCKCDKLKKKLELLRTAKPDARQLTDLLRRHRAPKQRAPGDPTQPGDREQPSLEDIQQIFAETPDTTFVAITKAGTEYLNQMCLEAQFSGEVPAAVIPGDPEALPSNFRSGKQVAWECPEVPIFPGMKLTLTKNVNKEADYVNGMPCTVLEARKSGIRVQTASGRYLVIYPYTEAWEDAEGWRYSFTYFPCRVGYATTLHKVQGATLAHMTMWLDKPNIEAAGYVALSRVQHDADWCFVGQLTRHHFTPASGV